MILAVRTSVPLIRALVFVAGFVWLGAVDRTAGQEQRVPPPPVPAMRSPVEAFRELLSMGLIERRQALTNRPPEVQRQILAKLREYESLKADQRELRLQATELRFFLMPLLSVSATERQTRLAAIPEHYRVMVVARLKEWDTLPAQSRTELLENEAALRYFTDLSTSNEAQAAKLREALSPERRERLEAGLKQWNTLPPGDRQKLLTQFNRFFELNPAEKQRALNTLSEAERKQMERTLKNFETLPPAQRAQCIRSFERFTSLSLEERQQFLKNAERWKLMSPTERQEWRELVARLPLQPPPVIRLPPAPPTFPARPASRPTVATNGSH